MKRYILRTAFVLLIGALSVTPALAQPEEVVKLTTGARQWRLSDGSSKRLRFLSFTDDGASANFKDSEYAPFEKPLNAFATEEQAVFEALKSGNLKLIDTPGLSLNPNFPIGKLNPEDRLYGRYWYGETRIWENTGGKRIKARLASLTDEDVSVAIEDSVVRISLAVLSAADLAYLEKAKRGEVSFFTDRVFFNITNWQGTRPFRFMITGEHYASLKEEKGDFETALAAVLKHVSSKLKKGDWELESFSEGEINARAHPSSEDEVSSKRAKQPYFYEAVFNLTKKAEKDARKIWPLNMSPVNWGSAAQLSICVLADGEIPTAELLPSL